MVLIINNYILELADNYAAVYNIDANNNNNNNNNIYIYIHINKIDNY